MCKGISLGRDRRANRRKLFMLSLQTLKVVVMSLEEDAADDANTPGANSKTDISNKANTIGVPVFVLNLERRHDRREHMLALLRGVGFSNVTVVNAISYEQLDWDSFQTVVLCSGP